MPGPNGEPIEGDLPHKGPDGKLYNWDGTPVTDEQASDIKASAEGGGSGNTSVQGTTDWGDPLGMLGFLPKTVDPNAPGATLDNTNADAERARLAPLLASLQQQAATGGGKWEGSLADATAKAQAGASALGQSQPGVGYGSALRNIGNAQAATQQKAVGQGNILREQSKQSAAGRLGDLLNGQGNQDINQASATGAVDQGVRELNLGLAQNAQKAGTNAIAGAGGLLGALLSDGGEVPGKPKVFGNDSRNDTVPAWLSPGEIVIPRSHAESPESAAQFVAALRASKGREMPPDGAQHFDAGGEAGTGLNGTTLDDYGGGNAALTAFLPHVGLAAGYGKLGAGQQAPSVQNGGLLDTKNFDENRANANGLADVFGAQANGPSVIAGQQAQNANDSNIAAAMQAAASGRRGVGAADAVQMTTAANQDAAGAAGVAAGQQQEQGQAGMTRTLLAQRERDFAMARARQQAAFRNTQINAGLGLEQQAALRGILSGAGQAAAAYSGAERRDSSYDPSDLNTPDFDASVSDPSEYENPFGDSSGGVRLDPEDKWTGGVVGMASGGKVDVSVGRPRFTRIVEKDSSSNPEYRASVANAQDDADRENADFKGKAAWREAARAHPQGASSFTDRLSGAWHALRGDIAPPADKKPAELSPKKDKQMYAANFAEGGEVTEDEARKAADFVTALRRRAF